MKLFSFILVTIISLSSFSQGVKKSPKKMESEVEKSMATKTWLIQTSPIAILYGSLNASIGKTLSDHSVLSGLIATSSYSSSITGFSLGASYAYWLSGNKVFTDSWTIEGSLSYATARSSSGSSIGGLALTGIGYYNWFWPNGFNLNVGLGLSYLSLDLNSIGGSRVAGIVPAIGFNIGYIF